MNLKILKHKQAIINACKRHCKRYFGVGLIVVSLCLGGVSIFALGYQVATKTLESKAHPKPISTISHNPKRDSKKPTKSIDEPKHKPIMPQPRFFDENVIVGNLSITNALSIAQTNLLEGDFSRARIWIYRAYMLNESLSEIWRLYLQSWQEDISASNTQKEQAFSLYEQAKDYFGF